MAVSLLITLGSEIELKNSVKRNSGGLGLLFGPFLDLVIDDLLIFIGELETGRIGT